MVVWLFGGLVVWWFGGLVVCRCVMAWWYDDMMVGALHHKAVHVAMCVCVCEQTNARMYVCMCVLVVDTIPTSIKENEPHMQTYVPIIQGSRH